MGGTLASPLVPAKRLELLGMATLLFGIVSAITYSTWSRLPSRLRGFDDPWWWPLAIGALGLIVASLAAVRGQANGKR